eukprot:Sdes_comp9094_c0_seq1m550
MLKKMILLNHQTTKLSCFAKEKKTASLQILKYSSTWFGKEENEKEFEKECPEKTAAENCEIVEIEQQTNRENRQLVKVAKQNLTKILHHRKKLPPGEWAQQMWTCGLCKRVNVKNRPTCAKCGVKYDFGKKLSYSELVLVEKAKMKEAHWKCPSCSHLVNSESTKCLCCGEIHPQLFPSTEKNPDSFSASWKCFICQQFNPALNSVCAICSSQKPKVARNSRGLLKIWAASDGTWKCIDCGRGNRHATHACKSCHSLRPDFQAVSVVQDWDCVSCRHLNFASSSQCLVCGKVNQAMKLYSEDVRLKEQQAENYRILKRKERQENREAMQNSSLN